MNVAHFMQTEDSGLFQNPRQRGCLRLFFMYNNFKYPAFAVDCDDQELSISYRRKMGVWGE